MVEKKEIFILAFLLLFIFAVIILMQTTKFKETITGYASSTQQTNVSIAVSGANPITIFVWNSSFSGGIDPIEETTRAVQFNVTIWDPDGVSDINTTSVSVNITRGGVLTSRYNSSCKTISGESNATAQNFSCTVTMWYWDSIGGWNINVSATDLGNLSFINNASANFSYNQLQSIKIDPKSLTWLAVSLGATNQTSNNDPTTINNTGNYNASTKLAINAINLHGQTTTSEFINVKNFSVFYATGVGPPPVECNGTLLTNGTDVAFTWSVLEAGNLSASQAQEQVYYCINKIPSTISSQTYSTLNGGSWTVKLT